MKDFTDEVFAQAAGDLLDSLRVIGEAVLQWETWELLPVGISWDIVVTPYLHQCLQAAEYLDRTQPGGCGPLLADPDRALLLWLVPPGTLHTFTSPHGIAAGRPFHLAVPPPEKTTAPGRFWLRPHRHGHLSDPWILATALDRFTHTPVDQTVLTALLPGSAPQRPR